MTRSSDKSFAVIGGGMAGILSVIKLREAGFGKITLFEKADQLGGTWRENTYPGVACDVPSHLYSYSFELNPDWSHLFSPGPEIHKYLLNVATKYQVLQHCRLGDEVSQLTFESGKWKVETASGFEDIFDFVVAATGVLHHPSYPSISQLDKFEGHMFHSARWDHSVEIEGKSLGIIGTGSTAVQIVAATAEKVGKLNLFQRTPQWVLQVQNPSIDDKDKEKYRENPSLMLDLHEELSKSFSDNFANAVVDANSKEVKILEELCKMNLENNVKDPILREKLRPNYRAACKRLVISPNFYEALQSPNANLITSPIMQAEPEGIRTQDGELHKLDVLVLATGFRVDRFMRPIEVFGRDGISLDQVWRERPSAYLAISIPDFPNMFMLNGPNGPVGNFSLIEVAEVQFAYIMQLVERAMSIENGLISATHRAAEVFEAERIEAAKNTVWVTGCKSWYLDDRGVPAAWPWNFEHFRERMAKPIESDYELYTPVSV